MNYGLYLSNYGLFGSATNLVEIAQVAEDSGWDGIFLWDHINPTKKDVEVVDPWVALTAIAANTSGIRIGTTVTPIPRRRPQKLARETVSLDQFSNGRLILGTGLGTPNIEDFVIFGEEVNRSVRAEILDEGLQVLEGLWSAEPFVYDGKHFNISAPVTFLPPPVQSPRIPVWTAGFWNYKNYKPFRRAARWDGCIPILSAMKGKSRFEVYSDIYHYISKHRGDMDDFDLVMIQSMKAKEANSLHNEFSTTPIISWWLDTTYNLYNKSLDSVLDLINQGPLVKESN